MFLNYEFEGNLLFRTLRRMVNKCPVIEPDIVLKIKIHLFQGS